MALIDPVPISDTSLGVLTVDTVFTCKEGHVGISTDGAPASPKGYYDLVAGDRIIIPSGLTVNYQSLTAIDEESVLHHMPVSA